jgi:hypothetical protein
MIRAFDEWWNSLPRQLKEVHKIDEKPQLSYVNYIWITNLMNNVAKELNPTVEELLEWVKSGQLNAKRK